MKKRAKATAQLGFDFAGEAEPTPSQQSPSQQSPPVEEPSRRSDPGPAPQTVLLKGDEPGRRRLRLVRDDAPSEGDDLEVDAPASTTLALPGALRLERNLALLAGAGTGKTYSLVTMCLHLLGGARAGGQPVPPDQLGLLTFTDKAAAEMRERLRRRLDGLADGNATETELADSFDALGLPMPPPRFWRRIRDDLGAATIGTFHSLCTQLLRRAPAGSGVNPGFTLLDERDARELLRSVIEREVLRRLEANDPLVTDLVRELQFGGASESGFVDGLMSVFVRLREEGSQPQFLRITDPIAARREFDRTLAEAQTLTREGIQRAWAKKPKENEKARELAALLGSTSFESYLADAPFLQKISGQLAQMAELKEARKLISTVGGVDDPRRLDWLHAAVELAPYEATIRELLADVMRLHEHALHSRGVLDFTGMLLQARNLLRDVPTARLEAQARFGALLVDEFQDTNRVQLELVMLLAEQRQGAPRPISESLESASQEVLELPLTRAFLAVVGDRKQGIYEFRGADVTVFEEMARRIEASGGGRAWLQTSWRSSPTLVNSLNSLMLRVLAKEKFDGAPRAFEVVYTEHDHLKAERGHVELPPIIQLTAKLPEKADVEVVRALDADAVARFVSQRLADPTQPLRGGQMAMLFQRLTQLEVYRQALVRHGVRHRIVRGRGFFGAQEVVDIASWLKLLATPGDAMALAAVLRSPLVGLSDASLVRLAVPTRGLDSRRVLFDSKVGLDGFAPDETRRFERFRSLYWSLAAERDRLGLRALVKVTLQTLEVREALAAGPFGEQALANIEKLLELATTRQTAGIGAGEFAQELLQLAQREPREAQGDVLDAYDPDAVTLCTVHQAKGLEWPVVVLPELFAARRSDRELIWFDRNEGLALRPFGMPESVTGAVREKAISTVRNRRSFAENLRLLYVAMTRARDQVVLGLMPKKVGEKLKSWSDVLQNDSWNEARAIDVDTLPLGAPPVDPVTEPAVARAEVQRVLDRVRHAPIARPVEAVLPVTQLQDFVGCPRRFHFAHQIGLAERPRSFAEDELPAESSAPTLDVRARGTAAHRLLELTPLEAVGTPLLRGALRDLRRAEDLPDDSDESILSWVVGFWESPAGRRIAALGEARVLRELPFVLPLRSESGDFTLHLRGQIDLVVDGPEGLEVLDYKTSKVPPAGLEPYAFQLGCYTVAAVALLAATRPARAGIVFLREEDRSPHFLPSVIDAATLRRELVEQARALTRSQSTQFFQGRALETCRALGCGYVYRCHPDAAGP